MSSIKWELRILSKGEFPDGTRTGLLPIPDEAFAGLGHEILPSGLPRVSERSPELRQPILRLSEATGSTTNSLILLPTERQINSAKNTLMQINESMDHDRFYVLSREAARGDRSAQESLVREFDLVTESPSLRGHR